MGILILHGKERNMGILIWNDMRVSDFWVNHPFNTEIVKPNRWTKLTKLSTSPSPLSDDDDVALITVELEPGKVDFILIKITKTICYLE